MRSVSIGVRYRIAENEPTGGLLCVIAVEPRCLLAVERKTEEHFMSDEQQAPDRIVLPNERAYLEAGRGDHSLYSREHCSICGRPAKGDNWLLLTRAEDGREEYAIGNTVGLSEAERNNVWIAPIGPECLKRHPELRFALLVTNADLAPVAQPPREATAECKETLEIYAATYHDDHHCGVLNPVGFAECDTKRCVKARAIIAATALQPPSPQSEASPRTRPYKEHLREQITDAEEATGYLSACFAEGPDTFALAVRDVWEFSQQRGSELQREVALKEALDVIHDLLPTSAGAGNFKESAIKAIKARAAKQQCPET